jgi:hypothetical protein
MENKPVINIASTGGNGDCTIALNWINAFRDYVGHEETYQLWATEPAPLQHFLPWASDVKSIKKDKLKDGDMDWLIVISDTLTFKIFKEETFMTKRLLDVFNAWIPMFERYSYVINKYADSMNLLAKSVLRDGYNRYTLPFAMAGLEYKEYKYPCNRPPKAPSRYVTINDGFSSEHKTARVTKNYDPYLWDEALKAFKKKYPDVALVQIGDKRSIPLRNIDICLLGKTSFAEMVDWVGSADLHVGNDSGPVHIRHLFRKPSVVLFGPSNADYYAYPENTTLKGTVCDECWWFTPRWNVECFLGLDTCARMLSITPNRVFDAMDSAMLNLK